MKSVTVSGHPALLLFAGVAALTFAGAFVYMAVRLGPMLPHLQKAGAVTSDLAESKLFQTLMARG